MQLNAEIDIHAAPELVWRVLGDFAAYPEWNPFITTIAGELRVGATLELNLSEPDGRETRIRPTLSKLEPGRELRWVRQVWRPSLFRSEHYFRLEALDDGRTRFAQGELVGGWLLKLMNRTLTNQARAFVYMNQALKRRAEGLGSERPPELGAPGR